MANIDLTDDQKRLLLLLSKFTKPAKKKDEQETWIKKIPLSSLIYRGIKLKIFNPNKWKFKIWIIGTYIYPQPREYDLR